MPKHKAGGPRFSPARPERIEELVRDMLGGRRRARTEAGAMVAELEKWAARFCARQPGVRDMDLFPVEISSTARALRNALEPSVTLGSLIGLGGRDDSWRSVFEPAAWRTFSSVLATMASHARKQQRPPEKWQALLEAKVLSLLRGSDLPWRTNQNAADLLAEIKAHALGIEVPRKATARLSALRRAVKRCSPAPSAADSYRAAYFEAKAEQVNEKLRQAGARLTALRRAARKRSS